MAGDRRAALIVQAAARGIVDFSKFDPFDRGWWLRLRLLLNEVESDNLQQMLVVQHRQHTAALEYTAGKQTFDHHWKHASQILATLTGMYFPWTGAKPLSRKEEYESLRGQWIERFGDPKDPAVQASVDRTVEFLQSRRRVKTGLPRKQRKGT